MQGAAGCPGQMRGPGRAARARSPDERKELPVPERQPRAAGRDRRVEAAELADEIPQAHLL
jgi:hypothetical protein